MKNRIELTKSLTKELSEFSNKLAKLYAFLGSEDALSITEESYDLLLSQANTMQCYIDILRKRILLANKE